MSGVRNYQFDHLFTVAMVGDVGVGKTSLLLREADNTFSSFFIKNKGIDFKIKSYPMSGKEIKAYIWDAPGRIFNTTLTDEAIKARKNAQLIYLVYDVTDEQSFQNIRDHYRNIKRERDPNNMSVIILIGAKNDLNGEKVVGRQRAQDLANELDIPFFEVSARFNQNVNEAFQRGISDTYNRLYPTPVTASSRQEEKSAPKAQSTLSRLWKSLFSSSSNNQKKPIANNNPERRPSPVAPLDQPQFDQISIAAKLAIMEREMAQLKRLAQERQLAPSSYQESHDRSPCPPYIRGEFHA